MAKILHRGTPKQEDRYLYTCEDCQSVIEFTLADLRSVDPREGPFVECPVCHYYIDWQVVKAHGTRVQET